MDLPKLDPGLQKWLLKESRVPDFTLLPPGAVVGVEPGLTPAS